MDVLLRVLLDIRKVKLRLDDDLVDRFNRKFTSSLLMMFAVLVSVRQYWGDAIHCWCPEVCPANHEKYANMYCWVHNTYYVPFDDNMLQPWQPRQRRITYYQWTPIILVTQAVLFFLPCAVWRVLNRRSGINIGVIMEAALASERAVYPDNRQKTLRYAVHLMDRYLLAHQAKTTGCCGRLKQFLSKHCVCIYGRFSGNYLTFCYIIVKLLYVGNAIAQLFLLDLTLGYDFHMFGIQVMRYLILGEEWKPSERFPKVTLCDFEIRQSTNVHQYTVQCVLPINLFNEKIFTIVWFLLFISSIVTFFNLIHWLVKLSCWSGQVSFVKRQLKAMHSYNNESRNVQQFTEHYLRRDGLFILRLVSKNAGELISTELLVGLWENFGPKQRLLVESPEPTRTRDVISNGKNTRSCSLQRLDVV